ASFGTWPVPPAERRALLGRRAHRQPLAPGALAERGAQLVLDVAQALHLVAHPQGEAEHVLSAQEQGEARMTRPLEAEGPRQDPRRGQGGIALDIAPARGHRARPGVQTLEQGRLAAAVLADQEGDAGPEVEALERAEDRERERKAIGLPRDAAATQTGEERSRRGARLTGAPPVH